MRLLVDSDIFCKLGVAGLLGDALAIMGVDVADCGLLPALPHMLRRGRLPNLYGGASCLALLPMTAAAAPLPRVDAKWLDPLSGIQGIDPGDALLLGAAAQYSLVLVTGDKRALAGVAGVGGYAGALAGRVVVLEALLLALCHRLGLEETAKKVAVLEATDQLIRICFSPGNTDPQVALRSYYQALATEVEPLVLWKPEG